MLNEGTFGSGGQNSHPFLKTEPGVIVDKRNLTSHLTQQQNTHRNNPLNKKNDTAPGLQFTNEIGSEPEQVVCELDIKKVDD